MPNKCSLLKFPIVHYVWRHGVSSHKNFSQQSSLMYSWRNKYCRRKLPSSLSSSFSNFEFLELENKYFCNCVIILTRRTFKSQNPVCIEILAMINIYFLIFESHFQLISESAQGNLQYFFANILFTHNTETARVY